MTSIMATQWLAMVLICMGRFQQSTSLIKLPSNGQPSNAMMTKLLKLRSLESSYRYTQSAHFQNQTNEAAVFSLTYAYLAAPLYTTHNSRLIHKTALMGGLRKYYQDTKSKAVEYWRRVPPEMNRVQAPLKHISVCKLPESFFTSTVIEKLAEIELSDETAHRGDTNKIVENSPFTHAAAFTRMNFLQFLADVHHTLSFMETRTYQNELKLLNTCGPCTKANLLKQDIEEICLLIKLSPPCVGEIGKNYTNALNSIYLISPIAYLAHMYNFYKEWSISSKTLLSSASNYLKIYHKFKAAGWDPDISNFEATLDLLATQWSHHEKDIFLKEIQNANELPMNFTNYFIS